MLRLLVLFSALSCLVACSQTKQPEKAEMVFHYYPLTNIYYDPVANHFIYSLDSAKTWTKYTPVSGFEPGTMGKKVLIPAGSAEIWKENEAHRKTYNGSMLHIATDTVNNNATLAVATERKTTRAAPAKTVEKEEEPKKPGKLKKFFNNIFKKKKKEEQ